MTFCSCLSLSRNALIHWVNPLIESRDIQISLELVADKYMTYQFQLKSPQDFHMCHVPTDLHAMNGNKGPILGGTEFVDKALDFFHLISDQRMSTTIVWSWKKFGSPTRLEKGLYYGTYIVNTRKDFFLAFHLTKSWFVLIHPVLLYRTIITILTWALPHWTLHILILTIITAFL